LFLLSLMGSLLWSIERVVSLHLFQKSVGRPNPTSTPATCCTAITHHGGPPHYLEFVLGYDTTPKYEGDNEQDKENEEQNLCD
jgi:hypothetical protein